MNVKYPDQRIAIFIDVQNMYYSARALYGNKVNFGEIVKTAASGRKVVRAIAYAVKAEMPEEQSFFDALEKAGLEVKTKELQTFVDGHKKADWDVGIAVDILKMAPKLDAVVLVSGDGDFQILMHHTKAEGCRAEVMSFGKSTSSKLIEEADDFTDLDIDPVRYLLNYQTNKAKTSSSRVQGPDKTVEQPLTNKSAELEEQVITAVNNTKKPRRTFFKKPDNITK